MTEIAGKVALVTGGASGIGLGLARALAHEDAKIVLADRDEGAVLESTESLRSEGADAIAVHLDVTDWSAWQDVLSKVKRTFGPVGILCNNAGVSALGTDVKDMDLDFWRRVLAINLDGVFNGVRAVLPTMIAEGLKGHIVNTASIAGLGLSRRGIAHYAASKSAVVALTESLAPEVEDYGIGVSVLCPGAVRTELWRTAREALGLPPMALAPNESAKTGSASPNAIDSSLVGKMTVDAIKRNQLYVLANAESFREAFEARHQAILTAFDRATMP